MDYSMLVIFYQFWVIYIQNVTLNLFFFIFLVYINIKRLNTTKSTSLTNSKKQKSIKEGTIEDLNVYILISFYTIWHMFIL